MKVLHILNDGPNDDAQYIIDRQTAEHDIEIFDLSKSNINYNELVDKIEQAEKVISW